MIKKSIYINLHYRTDRNDFILNQLSKSKLLPPPTKKNAIDGKAINPKILPNELISDIGIDDILLYEPRMLGLTLTQGSLGLILTWMDILRDISEKDNPTIIFEDDTILADRFDVILEKILNELPQTFDLCYLGYGDDQIDKMPFSKNLFIPNGKITCLPAIIVSYKGANKMLELMKNIEYQLDTFLYLNQKNIETYAVTNPITIVNKNFDSDIQGIDGCIKNYK